MRRAGEVRDAHGDINVAARGNREVRIMQLIAPALVVAAARPSYGKRTSNLRVALRRLRRPNVGIEPDRRLRGTGGKQEDCRRKGGQPTGWLLLRL